MRRLHLAPVLIIVTGMSVLAADPAQPDRETRYTYYVQGITKVGRVQSESYTSKERAFEELEAWKKEHGPGGLLESDPFIEGPEVIRESDGKPDPPQPEPIDPQKPQDRPGETSPGDAKPGSPAVPSIAGKKATGVIGSYKATMTFSGAGNQGEVIISGDVAGKGKWRQDGSELTMETVWKTYRATIGKDGIKGFQFDKEKTNPPPAITWSVTFEPASRPAVAKRPTPKSAKPATKVTKPSSTLPPESEVIGRWFDRPENQNGGPNVAYTMIESGGTGYSGSIEWTNMSGQTVPAEIKGNFTWTMDKSGIRMKWTTGDFANLEGLIPWKDFKEKVRK